MLVDLRAEEKCVGEGYEASAVHVGHLDWEGGYSSMSR